jgi:hypothetical protein
MPRLTRDGCELRCYVCEVSGEVLGIVLVVSWLAHALRVRTSSRDSRCEHVGYGVLHRGNGLRPSHKPGRDPIN